MNAPWSYSGSRPTVGFQEMKEQIAWLSLGANNCNPCLPPLTRKPKPCSERDKNVSGKEPLETTNPSTDPVNRLARHEQTTIFRLRTGHCGLRAHLKRTGIMVSALYDCKEAEQMVHHILQDCPIPRKQRHQFWPQDESTTNKLWGTAEDLRCTTQFLATEGLSTADRPQKKKKKLYRSLSLITWLTTNQNQSKQEARQLWKNLIATFARNIWCNNVFAYKILSWPAGWLEKKTLLHRSKKFSYFL